jgi:lipoprotein-releasing system ATP-binding protein
MSSEARVEPLAPETAGARPAIVARNVTKRYIGGDGAPLTVLDGVDLEVTPGETIAVLGQSGAGKSTLLHLLGGLDRPTSGQVWLGEAQLSRLGEEELARLRTRRIGFVFQFHHLLREFTALENVMMPQLINGVSRRAAADRARELLSQVGLEGRVTHKPSQLSGGEQQRVAVARALANRPLVLLADEPSGNLDPHTSERLHELLFTVSREHASAMILVTHNLELAARADRVLRVWEARLVPARDDHLEVSGERYAP